MIEGKLPLTTVDAMISRTAKIEATFETLPKEAPESNNAAA